MINQNFVIISDPKFLYKGYRRWPGSRYEAQLALERCSINSSFDFVLRVYVLSEFPETLVQKVTGWTYSEFVCAALSYTFSNRRVSVYAWALINQILMNTFLSDDVSLFLKKNNFFYNERIKSDIIKGVGFSFKRANFPFGNEKCLRNALSFIEMDEKDIENLVKMFLIEKNFKSISNDTFFAINEY